MTTNEQTRKDTERANSRVFRTRINVNRDGINKLVTFDKGSYIHEIDQDSSDIEQGGGGGSVDFNGTVGICINGEPYYINIPYDDERGAYDVSEGEDFPIDEPE